MEDELNNLLEWRWVDDSGRAMTNWKRGNPPPVLDMADHKGAMRVEARVVIDERQDSRVG